jgi:hypothetical protein
VTVLHAACSAPQIFGNYFQGVQPSDMDGNFRYGYTSTGGYYAYGTDQPGYGAYPDGYGSGG